MNQPDRRTSPGSLHAVPGASLGLVLALSCTGIKTDLLAGTGGQGAAPGSGSGGAGAGRGDGGLADLVPVGSLDAIVADALLGGDGGPCLHELHPVVRDFRGYAAASGPRHPDFEGTFTGAKGIVQPLLGTDGKPVYAPAGATPATTSAANFAEWYRDSAGVNLRFDDVVLPLVEDPARAGTFVYDNQRFFPINGRGWDDCAFCTDNFHFTTEIHVQFVYRGGETFTFRGDDDVFVFLNGHLGIDLGGVHPAELGSIDLDAQAAALGIARGQVYQMDIFQAERHTTESTFRIETTLGCLTNIVIP